MLRVMGAGRETPPRGPRASPRLHRMGEIGWAAAAAAAACWIARQIHRERGVVSGIPEHKVQSLPFRAFRASRRGADKAEDAEISPWRGPLDRTLCPSLDIHRAGITLRRHRGYALGLPRR
jgi:hypothetical protein